jgi:integrin beta 1
LKACVQCQAFESGELFEQVDEFGTDKCSQCPFTPILVERAEDLVQNDERLCTFFDDDYCRFSFVYGFRNTGELQVWVQETKQCPAVVDVDTITPGVPGKGTVDISVDISILVINALSILISVYT